MLPSEITTCARPKIDLKPILLPSCCQQGLATDTVTWTSTACLILLHLHEESTSAEWKPHFLSRPLNETVPVHPSPIPGHPLPHCVKPHCGQHPDHAKLSLTTFACNNKKCSETSYPFITFTLWLNVTLAKAPWLNDLTRASKQLSKPTSHESQNTAIVSFTRHAKDH